MKATAAPIPTLTAAFALLASCPVSANDAAPRATGFVPSPNAATLRASVIANPKRGALLRATADPLPAQFDAREQGWITPIRDQAQVGTCWAFAAVATIEAQLKKSGRGEWDFSEKNMVNHRGDGIPFDYGGMLETAAGYLLRGSGPVLEAYDPYVGNTNDWPKVPSPTLRPALRVQDIAWTPPLDGTSERRADLKSAIREYGAVEVSMAMCQLPPYLNDYNHYCDTNIPLDHAVTVIGWDDNYPASNFGITPQTDGAWIVKNSWGSEWGTNGYFYVSYNDIAFGFENNGCVYIPTADDEVYDVVHGYDCGGPSYDTSNPAANPVFSNDLQAVVFTAADGETLAAVGIWTRLAPKPYEIAIYTNVTRGASTPTQDGVLAHSQSGTFARPGFTTIPLTAAIPLAAGTGYAVVYRQTGNEPTSTVVAKRIPEDDDPFYGGNTFTRGNGYVGWTEEDSSVTWQDAYYAGIDAHDTDGWALCIKAYTRYTTPAPAGELPGETEDGTAMLSDLKTHYSTLFYETFGFGPLSGLVGTSGHSLWSRWMTTGFDPSIPEDKKFTVSIDMSSGSPSITWDPDLGESRTYKVFGRDALSSESLWREVDRDNPAADGARFFRVSVSPLVSHGDL